MFHARCPRSGRPHLLSERRVVAVRNTADGIVVVLRCPCGHDHSYPTGRRREAPAA
ncbi:MAG TPA: hypothetical protein VGB14_08515 [Acidimicrobiales bacterium]|jgi:hypothetical protein